MSPYWSSWLDKMVIEDSITVPAKWHYLAGIKQNSPGSYIYSESLSTICAISLITSIHRSKNQGVAMKVVPLTIISSDLLAKILLPISMTLDSADLKDLVSEGEMLPPEVKTVILLN